MPINAINISTYESFILPYTVDMDRVKKTIKFCLLSTTLATVVDAYSIINSEKVTAKSYIKAEATDQCLNTNRLDLKMLARIRCIGTYEDKWDDANGKPASNEAVDQAEQFARQLPINIKEPRITLAADGEINFLWVFSGFKLDLGIYGDGSYSYYGKAANGKEFIADEKRIDEELPEEILALITHNH